MAECDQSFDGLVHRGGMIAEDPVGVARHLAVEQDARYVEAGHGGAQPRMLLVAGVENDAVDLPGPQDRECLDLALRLLVAAGEQDRIALQRQVIDRSLGDRGIRVAGEVGDQKADGPGRLGAHGAGGEIGHVAEFAHRLADPFARGDDDLVRLVAHPRDRDGGHARYPGDVADGRSPSWQKSAPSFDVDVSIVQEHVRDSGGRSRAGGGT